MAGASETESINELEENLECPVCLKVLTDPVTLPNCRHSFCKVCLEGVVETCRGEAPHDQPIREFRCPSCRATFTLDPDKRVADMPRNYLVCYMAKFAAVFDRGIYISCSNCRQSYESVAHCESCQKFLCRECLKIHDSYVVKYINIEHNCPICSRAVTIKKTLEKCGHSFCAFCIDERFKLERKCPVCLKDYSLGNQPLGKMTWRNRPRSLPGFELYDTIEISYHFEKGIQGSEHPNPGERYSGARQTAYLPNDDEGKKVCRLLKKAFDQKLIFTIGRSATKEKHDRIIWKDIPHKTSRTGGPKNNGYPDPDYLKKVQEELAAKGITE